MFAHEMGLLKMGKISLDGTKIKANASKHHALSWDYACKLELQLQTEVNELIRLAEQADTEEIPDGMDIPQELRRRQDRLNARPQLRNGRHKDTPRNNKNTKRKPLHVVQSPKRPARSLAALSRNHLHRDLAKKIKSI
jgi:hypothetical protein